VGEFSENLDKAKESPLLKVWHFLYINEKWFMKYCYKQNLFVDMTYQEWNAWAALSWQQKILSCLY
jgi:hypothetical protein